jgi:hypothetical protein
MATTVQTPALVIRVCKRLQMFTYVFLKQRPCRLLRTAGYDMILFRRHGRIGVTGNATPAR